MYAERAAKARENKGLDTTDQARGVNKKKDGVIVIDDNRDDDTRGKLVQGILVKEYIVHTHKAAGITSHKQQGGTFGDGKHKILPAYLFSLEIAKDKTHWVKTTSRIGFQQLEKMMSGRTEERQHSQSV